MENCPDERRVCPLGDDQFEALAQRVANVVWERVEDSEDERQERTLEALKDEIYRDFGEYMFKEVAKPIIRRFLQMVGIALIAAFIYWLKAKWGVEIPGVTIGAGGAGHGE